ncbi:MAG: 3-dehydroquinate synthase [Pseudomonadales bacterium]|jgi:3-dehydroquinate synthase
MDTLTVDLGHRSYPIYIGEKVFLDGDLLAKHIQGKQVMVVTNTTIAALYLDQIIAVLANFSVVSCVLPDGEQYKTLTVLNQIFDSLLEAKYDRTATLIALGGGVVGDMTGFAAASYQRGVNFIQIPTTVLSQVDSSVGGKTGVNHALGKNMIGAFYQPQAVFADISVLSTLPARELSAGIAEIIKYGLIQDESFLAWLEHNMAALLALDPLAVTYAVKRSCECKAEVVAQDEHEGGIRAILNLGHTFGHAIETDQGYGNWLHGEAVAAGIIVASALSEQLGWISSTDLMRVKAVIKAANLPTTLPANITPERFLELMSVDKKVVDDQLRFVLLKSLGEAVVTSEVDWKYVVEAIKSCQQ